MLALETKHSSPNIVRVIKSRRMRWAGHVARMGEERGVYRVLVGKPKGKRPLERPRFRSVDNIRMNLQEVGCGYMDWIGLAQDGDRWRTRVSAVMNLRVPWNAGNFLTSCKPVSFSRRTLHHAVSKYITSRLITMSTKRTPNRSHTTATQHKSCSSTLGTSLQSHVTSSISDPKIFRVTLFLSTFSPYYVYWTVYCDIPV